MQRLAALALGNEHHKRRQVLIERAKAIIEPRAHRRTSGELGSSLQEIDRRAVVDGLGLHGIDQRDFISNACCVGKKFTIHPHARLTVLGELVGRTDQRQACLITRHASEALATAHRVGKLLAGFLNQMRFVIKQIHLRRPP